MLSAESYLGLLDSIVRSVERLCESELLFGAQKERQCLVFSLLVYHRVDHSMNEYPNKFVAARNTRAFAALGEGIL